MTQQTFAVGENPRVQITNVDGSLSIQTWQERSISVESTGTLDSLRQDGDTVIISDHTGDLSLFVPAIRNGFRWITTDVSVTHLTGDASIEGAGEVMLNDIKGNVTLKNIAGSVDIENVGAVAEVTNVGGNLRATSMPTLLARKGIGGEALVSDVARLEIDAVGGSAELNKVGTATIHAVGGNLDAEGIETSLRCNVVGGDCHVHNSANAEVNITNVGGNLQMEGTLRGHMSNVGGNLHTRMTFPAGSSTHFHVGGNANVEMPDDASVALHAIVGGQVTGDALGSSSSPIYRGSSNFANLVYGDGAAKLSLFVGGNLRLLGSIVPRRTNMGESWNHFGREMTSLGREMGRIGRHVGREVAVAFKDSGRSSRWSTGKQRNSSTYAQDRAAILRMVAQGRITPEEGNMLLSGLRD